MIAISSLGRVLYKKFYTSLTRERELQDLALSLGATHLLLPQAMPVTEYLIASNRATLVFKDRVAVLFALEGQQERFLSGKIADVDKGEVIGADGKSLKTPASIVRDYWLNLSSSNDNRAEEL